jgi:hypothetical protein
MYSVHVCSTNDRDFPPPDLGRGMTWDRLTEILLREVSADAASLFAEPIRDEARDQTHWHITARDDPKPVSALPADEREKLMKRLDDRRQEIRRFAAGVEAQGGDANLRLAAALRAILTVPDESQHVWSADGKPVLTAWGRHAVNLRPPEARFLKRPPTTTPAPVIGSDSEAAAIHGTSNIAYEREDAPAPAPAPIAQRTGKLAHERDGGAPRDDKADQPAAEAVAPTALPPPPPIPRKPPNWAGALLWGLLALLVAGSYYSLLPACGVRLPLFGPFSDQCDAGRPTALRAQEERNFALRDSIAKVELEIAQKHSLCATRDRAGNDDPKITRPQKDAEQPRLDTKEAEKRRDENKGTRGKLDITLVWNGREDLDLHVYCPGGGHIFFYGRAACGGTLEIDRNSGIASAVENPLEHVTWPSDPPPGDYRVEVTFFDRFNLPERTIPFTVVVRDGDKEQQFSGQVQKVKETVVVTSFTR